MVVDLTQRLDGKQPDFMSGMISMTDLATNFHPLPRLLP